MCVLLYILKAKAALCYYLDVSLAYNNNSVVCESVLYILFTEIKLNFISAFHIFCLNHPETGRCTARG